MKSVGRLDRVGLWAGLLVGLLLCGGGLFAAPAALEDRTISVEVTAPDSGWSIHIEEVVLQADGLFVVAVLRRGSGAAANVLTKVRDQIEIKAPSGIPLRTFVLGKTWRWSNNENVVYLSDRSLLIEKFKGGQRLYTAVKKGGSVGPRLLDCVVILKPADDQGTVEERAKRIMKSIGGEYRGVLPGVVGFKAELNPDQVGRLRGHKEVLAVDALRLP